MGSLYGQVAQLAERPTENRKVGGSIPPLATTPLPHRLRKMLRGALEDVGAVQASVPLMPPSSDCTSASR